MYDTIKIDYTELLEKYNSGMNIEQLSNYYSCGDNTIRRRLKKLGIIFNKEKIKNLDDNWFIQKYCQEKMSANEIAKLLNCSKKPILSRLKKLSLVRDSSESALVRMSNPDQRKKISGSNHYNWQNGKTKINFAIRNCYEYKIWRKEVFKRDDYTCKLCGKKGGYLHVDHIKQMALIIRENNINSLQDAIFCKQLWDLSNGRTLCKSCHKKTETYASKQFNKRCK